MELTEIADIRYAFERAMSIDMKTKVVQHVRHAAAVAQNVFLWYGFR